MAVEDYMDEARGIAAHAWCDDETSHLVMIPALAEAFARRLARNIERLEWFGYEVDPEWRRFCEFGPDDIGGPFEKLGIIRKRPSYDTVVLSQRAITAMNEAAERQILHFGFDPSRGDSLSAMNVVCSDLIPPNQAYMTNLRDFMISNPLARMKFGDT